MLKINKGSRENVMQILTSTMKRVRNYFVIALGTLVLTCATNAQAGIDSITPPDGSTNEPPSDTPNATSERHTESPPKNENGHFDLGEHEPL